MAELSTLARPYAKAVFELARDGNAFAGWSKQLAAIAAVVTAPAVARAIRAPGVAKGELADAIIALTKDALNAQGTSLVKLLAENGRLEAVPALTAQYEALLAEAQKSALSSAVAKKLNRAVDITWAENAKLITGARIQAGDLVIDGSALGELERLKAKLLA
jgi:F-type H+-transporting ATPase subunit delta